MMRWNKPTKGLLLTLVGTSLLLNTISSCTNKDEIEFLTKFFKDYAPCGAPVYCYEYDFRVDHDTFKIETRLYNYEGDDEEKEKKRVLTKVTKLILPADQIRKVSYFPEHSSEIYIYSINKNIIRLQNGKREFVDFIPIDFNPYLVSDESKEEFRANLDALINALEAD